MNCQKIIFKNNFRKFGEIEINLDFKFDEIENNLDFKFDEIEIPKISLFGAGEQLETPIYFFQGVQN